MHTRRRHRPCLGGNVHAWGFSFPYLALASSIYGIRKTIVNRDTVEYRMSRGADSQVGDNRVFLLRFSGPSLVLIGSQGSGLADLSIRYEYGQLGLSFPRADQRVSSAVLSAAKLTLRAPKAVRRAADAVAKRTALRLARNCRADPVATIRQQAREVALSRRNVRFHSHRDGALLSITTRFGRSARSVTWNSRRGVVVVRAQGVKRKRTDPARLSVHSIPSPRRCG